MTVDFGALLLGAVLAGIIAGGAVLARALSPGGGLAAACLGTIVFGLGGLAWALLLIAFFASSTALSALFARRKQRFEEKFAKSARRDTAQVLANGGVAGAAVLLHAVFPASPLPWLLFAGALAAANADTWGTELGVLSPQPPRLITSGREAAPGTSGAISAAGTFAGLAGAALIALLALCLPPAGTAITPWQAAAIALAGLGGSLFDSLLGATRQAIYHCPACDKETERHPVHLCGSPTRLARGWRWLDNDRVNALATLAGALLVLLLAGIFPA